MSGAVVALVLTGGRSSRMGRDKATLVPDDGDPRPLAQRVLDALSAVAPQAMLAGGYGAEPPPGVAVVHDRNQYAGPLAALAGALARVPPDALAVVAGCDMPHVVPALVRHMVQRARDAPGVLCVLCATERGVEPLPSVWRPSAAALLDEAVRRGASALRDGVAALPHAVVPPEEWRRHDPDGACFVNWNTPDDLPHR